VKQRRLFGPAARAVGATALVAAVQSVVACGGDSTGGPRSDSGVEGPTAGAGGESPGPALDATAALYDPDRVLQIEVEMAPDDWDSLRRQSRSFLDVVGSSCLTRPPPTPFSYFSANLTIDGETVAHVGLRKKGFFGSLSDEKPSLKVKFDEYDPDQTYSGEKRLTLNNSLSDPSYVKQCLGYAMFNAAGVPAPRCNFAYVSVNGEHLGVYVNVENVKKRFLRRHFTDDEGHLYEGALSDFRPGWVDTFEQQTNAEEPSDRRDLETLVDALSDPDEGLLDRVEPLVDLDEFTSFWATEYLLMHADGYSRNTNNFYVYHDPSSGRFHFIPWGIDAIMFPDTALDWEEERPVGAAWAEGILARRLYNVASMRGAYFSRLDDLLNEVWRESALLDEIDRMSDLIEPHLLDAERDGWADARRRLREFVSDRRAQIEADRQSDPDYSGPLRDPWCIDPIGQLSATFATTWSRLDVEDPLGNGNGTLDLELDGRSITFLGVGSSSGPDEDSGQPAVRLVAPASETEIWVAQVSLTDAADFAPGRSVPIDFVDAIGAVVRLDLSTDEPTLEIAGILGEGVLELESAEAEPGGAVEGRVLASTLFETPF